MTSAIISDLANDYWQARWKEGGTVVIDGKVHDSDECKQIRARMDRAIETLHEVAKVRLRAAGVPEYLVSFAAGASDLEPLGTPGDYQTPDENGVILFRAAWPFDGYNLDSQLPDGYRYVDEFSDGGARMVWTDDVAAIITYCEGDLTVQWATTPEAYATAMKSAADYYGATYIPGGAR